MDLSTVKKCLADSGFGLESEDRLPNNFGTQLRFGNGAIVNVYDNGNYNVQGRNTEQVRNLLEDIASTSTGQSTSGNREIFVVYGHDEDAKRGLEILLRRWHFEPLFLDQLPSQGQTIIEKLERYTQEVQYAVVLATPDDKGYRAGHPDEKVYRARQNVVLEFGMMLAKLGRERVAILLKSPHSMERPSDIQGLVYIPFEDDIEDVRVQLAKELDDAGYNIPVSAL
jgi:predicted nucleotide-binding protein